MPRAVVIPARVPCGAERVAVTTNDMLSRERENTNAPSLRREKGRFCGWEIRCGYGTEAQRCTVSLTAIVPPP